ncbi:hypothetical protein M422DRAFT_181658, partial [Sphaerobolus stellatus SS14]
MKSKKVYITDDNQRLRIQAVACKFTYTKMLWIRHPNEVFNLDVDPDYDPSNRFKSLDEQFQGVLYELREEIPAKWHDDMDNEILIRTFMIEMSQQRSNGSHRIRQAGPFIFGCPNEIFHTESVRITTFREDIGFIMGTEGVGSYKKVVKILFKDYEGKFDKWKIFRNPIIMKTRFAASEDKSFQPCRSHTKIDYQEDFEFYLKYLHEGLHSKAPSVLDIIKTWNQVFYP